MALHRNLTLGLWERRSNLITKAKKTTQLGELKERFDKSKGIVLTEYKGLTVAQMAELRKQLKEVGGEYKVCKNTLVSLATKDTQFAVADKYLTGPTVLSSAMTTQSPSPRSCLSSAPRMTSLWSKAA